MAFVRATQAAQNHGSASVTSGAFGSVTNSVGNLLIVIAVNFTSGGQQISTITDTKTNTWVRQGTAPTGTGTTIECFAAANCAAGANVVTVNYGAAAFFLAELFEYSGGATATPLDVFKQTAATGTAHNSGNTTSTVAGELVVGGYGDSTAGAVLAVTDGKTQVSSDNAGMDLITSELLSTSSGVQSTAYSTGTSISGVTGCWVFKAAAAVTTATIAYSYGSN